MGSLNIYALQTARAGSKSVPNKNIMEFNGKPLYLHNVHHAKASNYIKDVFVSTDCEFILDNCDGYQVIDRPEYLCRDDSSHHETICHGLDMIEKITGDKVDYLVVLLGNSLSAYTDDLDAAIKEIISSPETDTILSASELNMYNPLRAFVNDNGYLKTYLTQDEICDKAAHYNINDKNSAGNIYFFNGSFHVTKRDVLFDRGKYPFQWMGNTIKPYFQDASCMELDAKWQIEVLRRHLL